LTVLVATAVFVMIRLGFWQLDRLHGRRDANAVISARENTPPEPLNQVLAETAARGAPNDAAWRIVTFTGTYRTDDEVMIRNRPQNSTAGYWVVTPLVAPDGSAVAVNRGWIPINIGDAGQKDAYAPPSGTVTVTGLVRETEVREGLEQPDPPGRQTTLGRVDVPRLQQQLPYNIGTYWLQLTDQQPVQTGLLPQKIDLPELDDGPHLNYFGQWMIFATLTVIVYPLAIRKAAKVREARARQAAEDAAAEQAAGGTSASAESDPADPTPAHEPVP
jgi:cytochrome oxidase assembly protein ShyY1